MHLVTMRAVYKLLPFDSPITVEKAAVFGRLDVLQTLVAVNKSAVLSSQLADAVAENGHLNVLQWLASSPAGSETGGKKLVFCDARGANMAAHAGHLNILEWLASPPAGSGREPMIVPT